MSRRAYSTATSTDTSLVTTAETVVATLTGVSTNRPGEQIRLRGQAQVTTGVGTTGLIPRIRRDSLTGTLLGEEATMSVEAAAGGTEDHDIYREDSFAGEVAGQVYVLTLDQVGATGNGTCLNASLEAVVG